jgi:AcrR family transcriptional regulator
VRARLDVDERRAQLLAVGLAAFSDRPYDDVSIDAIASAAGVSKGLLYHYFPTKRDLYVAALDDAAQRLCDETTRESQTEAGPANQLVRGLSTYLDFVERHGKAYVALMRGGLGSDPEVAAIVERTRRAFADVILEHVPGGEKARPLVAIALRGWIGFVEATSIDWVLHRSVHRNDLVELLAAELVAAMERASGIAARARRTPKARRR